MEETFTCSFTVSGSGTRKSDANIDVSYDFVNSATGTIIFSGNKSFDCTTNEYGVLIYNGGTTIPFKIKNEVTKDNGYIINVDCSIRAVEDNVTFLKNSITITHIENIEKDVWVEFNDYGELIDADLSGLANGYFFFARTNVGQKTNEVGTVLSETFDYDLPSLTDGSSMFQYCSQLESFSSNLSSLTDCLYMFRGCNALTSFSSDLPSLTNCEGMFYKCENLTSFTSDLPSLTDGGYMFFYCRNLESFSSDSSGSPVNLSNLTNGYCMFYKCENLTSFTSDLPSLTDGYCMFYSCKLDAPSVKNIALTINKNVEDNPRFDLGINSSITSDAQVKKDIGLIKYKGWNVYTNNSVSTSTYTLPKYAGCTTVDEIEAKDVNYLTNDIVNGTWTEHLPDLTNGWNMFKYNYQLESFNSDLSSLTDGTEMFRFCSNLTSFTSNLSTLTDGSWMFEYCTNLPSFTSDLPSLTNGMRMFMECTSLTSFSSDLSSLTNGDSMFEECENLASFSSDLASLKSGHYMFNYCKLDAESLYNIANNINNLVERGYDKDVEDDWKYEILGETITIPKLDRGRIDISHGTDIEENVLTECADILIKKGWDTYFDEEKQKIYEFNGSILLKVDRNVIANKWDRLYYGLLTFSGKRRDGRGCTLTFNSTDYIKLITCDTLALSPGSTSDVASGDLTLSVAGGTVTLTVTVTGNTMTISLKGYGGRADRVTITPYTQD